MNNKIILGLDVGTKRIGLAKGDPSVKIATNLAAITNDQQAIDKITKIADQLQVSAIVVGLPRNNNGKETGQSDFCRQFADKLISQLQSNNLSQVTVVMQDESLTSVEAEKRLRQSKSFTESMLRDGTLDSEAANIILTDYLERTA